ncbi:protein of unknown function (plasmid) [Magnetospirillum sp. XM-1]|nr:protein of unknown function [Magnetospirillum sp. XM-1]
MRPRPVSRVGRLDGRRAGLGLLLEVPGEGSLTANTDGSRVGIAHVRTGCIDINRLLRQPRNGSENVDALLEDDTQRISVVLACHPEQLCCGNLQTRSCFLIGADRSNDAETTCARETPKASAQVEPKQLIFPVHFKPADVQDDDLDAMRVHCVVDTQEDLIDGWANRWQINSVVRNRRQIRLRLCRK